MANNQFGIYKDDLVRIPDGIYELRYVGYSTSMMMGKSPKIAMRLQVVEYGDHLGAELVKYYGVRRLTSRPKESGGFKAGNFSDFLRDYFRFFPDQRISRNDRIPMSRFKEVIFRGRVKTVDKGFDQKKIPDQLRYSVVQELIEVKKI
jgi:hypothetical protein